ncbi:MAG: DNA polymerase III subunit alpha [Candidatus Melainabacteria bacterium RIFOXYA2_FULL_32_9]|nr:MAG: DNA polymerase III subunit alpha [Candidatus Melainabacteria bacterium RIFOXYA2_FULL_32_9]
MKPYVPLHLHTEYSLLDGATRIKGLIAHAKENNMPACAITDHGVMYGAVEFYKKAKEEGIKPIIGCEVYIIAGDITEKKVDNAANNHLVLLAKDREGYKNLVKLVSIAHTEGFYYKPRINHKILEKHKKGLICLSACLGGEVAQNVLKGEFEKARNIAGFYKNLFGEDYYIELQDHGMDEQKRVNPELLKIAEELEIKLVITNDSHYTKKQDAKWHDILLCLQTGKTLNDPGRMKFPNNEFYIKNADELKETFNWLDPEIFDKAIDNTVEISEKCNLIIDMGKSILPHYPVPPNHTVESYLDQVAREGLSKRFKEITPALSERFKFELKIIEEMGFAAYFLIVSDFIKHARDNGIPVGPGRGSAAGSLVAYALGITNIDPIRHNLLFERFLNPERVSMPDVDIDFCIDKREKVIEYVSQKYGEDKVCQIITFGTLAARAAMKGVARVLDIPYAESDKLAKMIPTTPKVKIDDALVEGLELKKFYESDPRVKELVDFAKSIEGIKFNIGTHAAGVIISRDPLSDIVPVQKSKEGIIITEYPMGDLEMLGLLKMDFLGLRNLTIIDNTIQLIKNRRGLEIEIDEVPLDDPKVYEMLSKGDTDGVFQLESSGMKTLVRDLKPSVFEDLGALVALFRPGPLNSGMVKNFVQRKHGRAKVEYKHPILEPILQDTYGTIVYQEQIMQIAQTLAGYTLGQADILRRAMGKKKPEEMDKQRELFQSGAQRNGVDLNIAKELFDTMTEFAAYCFNRSHSAAYAMLAYQTSYLKAHFPVEYMSALLSSVSNDQDRIQIYIAECQKMGIEVLPPDVCSSCADFTPDGSNIRFGLASVKNVGLGVVEAIVKGRNDGPFTSFYDFCTRVDLKSLNKRTLESLIKAGAFTGIEKSRKQVLENLESALNSATKEQEAKASGQMSLFSALSGDDSAIPSFTMTGSDQEFSDSEIQSFEKELLGFYVTSHPLSSIKDHLPFLTTHNVSELRELPEGAVITICGLISSVRLITTKTNKLLKVGTIEDLTGNVDFVAYSEVLNEYNSLLETEAKVILAGKTQFRGDEETTVSIIINSVKPVDNCNMVSLYFNEKCKFEDIVAVKDLLLKHKGSDPVILNVGNNGSSLKILAASNYWIQANNDVKNLIAKQFSEKISLSIKSLDVN